MYLKIIPFMLCPWCLFLVFFVKYSIHKVIKFHKGSQRVLHKGHKVLRQEREGVFVYRLFGPYFEIYFC